MTKRNGAAVLGHIDCPYCGTAKAMRITHDKNGAPFGYCEAECYGQMRVGGEPNRVRRFLQRFPWAAGTAAPVTGTEAKQAPAVAPAPVPEATQAPAPVPAPAPRKRSALEEAFGALVGGKA